MLYRLLRSWSAATALMITMPLTTYCQKAFTPRMFRPFLIARRQLNESRIKYIGMDVHKEATVIAVPNGSGKLVMESIVETKASSILQFIHGLRGELHVTWEEGTWAGWAL